MRIIIPSFGRCGSTEVFSATVRAEHSGNYGFVRSHLDIPGSGVFKTHCWAPQELDPEAKYIYVYGDPVMSAISAHRMPDDFQVLHYQNMGGNYDLRDYWPREDTLHIRQNYNSWKAFFGKPNVLPIHYDSLFTGVGGVLISEFVNLAVAIEPKVDRLTIFDPSNPDHIMAQKTYGDIVADSDWSI